MRRVFITGMGFTTSIGNHRTEVLESLRELKSGIASYGPFQREDVPVKVMGTLKGFDLESNDSEDWVFPQAHRPSRALLRALSPHGLYAFCAIEQALRDAGISQEQLSHERCGFFSASVGSMKNLYHNQHRLHEMGVDRLSPKAVVMSIPGTLNFSFVSHYKIKGHSCGFVSACASSGHALGFARDAIALGRQDRMLVVGAEDGDFDTILPFAAMRALSTEADPRIACLPFDVRRSGFVGTGGAVALILESEQSMRERGARPLVEFAGWGQSSDGFSAVLPDPEGAGLARAMTEALNLSGVKAEEVDYVNAHATATGPGDIAELRAIKQVFGTREGLRISSTKALTGHGLSLASILETALTTLAMTEGFIPGTAGLQERDPEAIGLHLPSVNEACSPKVAISNSSGFGGANVCLVLRQADGS
jgi:3-oxoacyl-[acyl-carrier-protein] synthase-1